MRRVSSGKRRRSDSNTMTSLSLVSFLGAVVLLGSCAEAVDDYPHGTYQVGSSDARVKEVRVEFGEDLKFSAPPSVNTWTRGESTYQDRFATTVTKIETVAFTVSIQRTDAQAGWTQNPILYWSVNQLPSVSDLYTSMGTYSDSRTAKIPVEVWVYSPSIYELTDIGTYDLLGREIHLSTAKQILAENAPSKFPVAYTESSKDRSLVNLRVRADTVYLDQADLDFQGLASVTISARKVVSNNHTLILKAPTVCETLEGSKCGYLSKAGEMSEGKDGKSGHSSPELVIYAHEIEGNLNVVSQGSNGNVGEEGGDGEAGVDITEEQPGLGDGNTCDDDCGPLFGDKRYEGNKGTTGGDGADGKSGGKAGDGGDVTSATVVVEKVSGYMGVKQEPGTGGVPVAHGYGGRPGQGGPGGCGRICHAWLMCIITICWPECNSDPSCDGDRGDTGDNGAGGSDGFAVHSTPVMGSTGSTSAPSLTEGGSVKMYFQYQDDLLDVMWRHGETSFMRNDNEEAEEIFSFLYNVTTVTSSLHQEVKSRLEMIDSGFDYYGNDEMYAPDLDWSYLSDRTDALLETGEAFEQAYNTVQGDINDVILASQTVEAAATVAITTHDRELANQESELKSQKQLYYSALRELERSMKAEMVQINVLVPLAIIQEKVQELIAGIPSLLGGIVGFVGGLIHLNPSDAFNSALQVMDVFHDGRHECHAPQIEEAFKTLHEKLDFGYEYQALGAENIDFSTMDTSAVPQIMLSELGKNKASLVYELRCLYDNENSDIVVNLERVINDYFRDGALRISLIDQLLNIDIQLKELAYSRGLLAEAQTTITTLADSAQGSVAMETKMSFADLLLNLYQLQESAIMRAIYEQSKAYQFSCLWDFHALDMYTNVFSDQVLTDNIGSLNGMFHLEQIRTQLVDERDVFLNMIAPSAGPTSHTFTLFAEFTSKTNPDVISDLHEGGQFTVKLELDPDDVTVTGCDNCYNARLVSLYVELTGEKQDSNVPPTVYLQVAHMGDNYFLVPSTAGDDAVVTLQQTPENTDGGHVMTFDWQKPVSNSADPQLQAKLLKSEHKMCENGKDFFGEKPCKSPYSTYVVTVPRSDSYDCTLDPNLQTSGVNCKDLDLTKFSGVRVYAKVESWSDYPSMPDDALMKRYVEEMHRSSE